MCDKPISPVFWDLDEVGAHWDTLTLKSSSVENGAAVAYQDGPVTKMRDPRGHCAQRRLNLGGL